MFTSNFTDSKIPKIARPSEVHSLRIYPEPADTQSFSESEFANLSQDVNASQALTMRIALPLRCFMINSLLLQVTIPEIARTVQLSGNYKSMPDSRFEQTRSFIKTIFEHGPSSPLGDEAIERVRKIHASSGGEPTSPAFGFVLYTLSTVLVRSLRNYSAACPTLQEELALFRIIRATGEKLGAVNLPGEYGTFVRKNEEFLVQTWETKDQGCEQVAKELIGLVEERTPRIMRRMVKPAILSFADEDVLRQLNFDLPSQFGRGLCQTTVRMSSLLANIFV